MEIKPLEIRDTEGKKAGEMTIPETLSAIEVSIPLLHEITRAFTANQREGTASTKTRAEVRGGGIKPWRQKGTGRARSGSIRSPLWRKGGIVFGPKPRSYRQDLPRKKMQIGMLMALKSKWTDNEIIVIKDFTLETPKTKKLAEILKKLGIKNPHKYLLLVAEMNENLKRSARNIYGFEIMHAQSVHAYDLLRARGVIITESAFSALMKTARGKVN